MAKYIVNVIINTCVELEVEAQDEKEAQTVAIAEVDSFMVGDWVYEFVDVCRNEDNEQQ